MRTGRGIILAMAVGLLAAGAWLLLPTALGGRTTYVVTHGISMEPSIHTGDLAIVYPVAHYRRGDVAAYRSDLLRTTVLHRITATSAKRYTFKGDNNSWVDPERPTRGQLVGRLVVRVPHGGVVLSRIHQPALLGLLTAALVIPGARRVARLRRRGRRRTHAERATMNLHRLNHRTPGSGTSWAVCAGALLFAGTALMTYLVPGQSVHREKVPWTAQVDYGYGAVTTANLVYPDGKVQSGQTVFRKLVTRVSVHATWSLYSPASQHLEGAARLQAVVHGPDGWTQEAPLGRPARLVGEQVTLSGTLDLARLDAQVRRAVELTGIPAENYTVSVRPLVTLRGTLAGIPVSWDHSRSGAAMLLAVTPATVTPATAPPPGQDAGPAGASSTWARPEPTTGFVTGPRRGAATWQLLGQRWPVSAVRWVSISGAVLGLGAAVLLALMTPVVSDPCLRKSRRRGSVISVSELQLAPTSDVVRVTSMDELVRIAQHYDRLILHQETAPGVYLVEDETGLYRYECTHRGLVGGHRQAGAPPRPGDGPVLTSA